MYVVAAMERRVVNTCKKTGGGLEHGEEDGGRYTFKMVG